jgi:hypothetical protein
MALKLQNLKLGGNLEFSWYSTKYELVLSKDKRLVVYTRQWDEVKDKGNPVNPLLYKSGVIIHS